MNKLKELEQKYKELGEEIERLKNQGKVWKPENNKNYWLIGNCGDAWSDNWSAPLIDEKRYALGNCFKTKEEAEATVEKIKIYTQLKRLAEEINTEPVNWKENYTKYYICYKPAYNSIESASINCQQDMGIIYSTNPNFLKIAKERIGEENLLKLFKED